MRRSKSDEKAAVDVENEKAEVRIVTKVQGVVLPTWVAIAVLSVILVCAGSLVQLARTLDRLEREIRILQLHARDIESVLIRSGVADRNDFAPWEGIQQPEDQEGDSE